jgi:hypothetical protein
VGGHCRVIGDAAAGQQRWVTFGAAQSLNDAVVTFREVDQQGALAAAHSYRWGGPARCQQQHCWHAVAKFACS